MARWSVVIWAVVTSDLVEPFRRDMLEVTTALEAMDNPDDVQVHAYQSPPGKPEGTREPVGVPDDGPLVADLPTVLSKAGGWSEADRRMLVLWGHGTRAFPPSVTRGTGGATAGNDDVAGSVTAPAKVGSAFPAAGSSGEPKHPDVIGYDACRMASVATAVSLARDFPAAIFVGSMVPEPASGWPYFQLLRILRNESTPKAVASELVEAYAGSVDSADWCIAALDLSLVGTRSPTGLAKVMSGFLKTKALDAVDFLAAAQGADILDDTNFVDLGALMGRISEIEPDGDTALAAGQVRTALQATVVARRAAGSLSGRDGVSVLLSLPGDPSWPASPKWEGYLRDPFGKAASGQPVAAKRQTAKRQTAKRQAARAPSKAASRRG